MRKLSCALMVCLLLAGCNVIPAPSAVSILWKDQPSASTKQRKQHGAKGHEQKGWWSGFWFQSEEPGPPESLDEWMQLEPIRP